MIEKSWNFHTVIFWLRHCLYLVHCNLPKSQEVRQLVTVEVAGHVDAFTPDDDDFVAFQMADRMATAVDAGWKSEKNTWNQSQII